MLSKHLLALYKPAACMIECICEVMTDLTDFCYRHMYIILCEGAAAELCAITTSVRHACLHDGQDSAFVPPQEAMMTACEQILTAKL